jgi:hypothetical protein
MLYEQFSSPEALQDYCNSEMAKRGFLPAGCGCSTATKSPSTRYETKGNHMSTFKQHYQQAQQSKVVPGSADDYRLRKEQARDESMASMKRLQNLGADVALRNMTYLREHPEIASIRRSTEKMNDSFDRLKKQVELLSNRSLIARLEAQQAAQALAQREYISYAHAGGESGY